jgi:hypothetical protein
MRKRITRYCISLAVAIGVALPSAPAEGALRNACQVLPGSQVQRIFGTPVTTSVTSQMGDDARSSVCHYTGTTTLAIVQYVFAASSAAATDWEKRMLGTRSPAVKVGRKGNTVVWVQSMKPGDTAKIGALFDAAMRALP